MHLRDFLLIKLMEEAAEVQQRASKLIQFGPEEIQQGYTLNNAQRLREEWKDLQSVMRLMVEGGIVEPFTLEEFDTALEAKRAKLDKYLKLSYSYGMVLA